MVGERVWVWVEGLGVCLRGLCWGGDGGRWEVVDGFEERMMVRGF